MIGIKRAKGVGLRSTTLEIGLRTGSGWHAKIRSSSNAEVLNMEAEKVNWASDVLPVASKAFIKTLPGISVLLTKTLDGNPSFGLVGILPSEKLIAGITDATNRLRSVSTVNILFIEPEWTRPDSIETNLGKLALSKQKHRQLHPDFSRLTLNELRDMVDKGPGEQAKVLTHGDWCMPNVLMNSKGQVTGIVDLGELHVGDEKLDPAIMSWTIRANMGNQWEDSYLNSLNLNSQDDGINYQRLIYDLGLKHSDPWSWLDDSELAERRVQAKRFGE
jgi:aminoglycoside phosphotransferase